MRTVLARAYAFDSTFRLRELAALFGGHVELAKDELKARFVDGEAICFDFGSVVFFGADSVRDAIIGAIAGKLAGEPHAPLTEELRIDVELGAEPTVHFDRLVVPALDAAAMGVIALLLAQSVAMDYYSEDVDDILMRTAAITRDLATRGRLRGRVRDIIRFIGSCIQTKNGVIETLALFDKPEEAWEEEMLHKLFGRLRESLEIDDRFRALEYKLRMIQENLVLLADLSQQRHAFFLEAGVLVLILLELIVMVWQLMHGNGT